MLCLRLQVINKVMSETSKDVLANEMKVLRSLHFGLLLDPNILEPHLVRICDIISTTHLSTHPNSQSFMDMR